MSRSYNAILFWGFEFENSEACRSSLIFQGSEDLDTQVAEKLRGAPFSLPVEEMVAEKLKALQATPCQAGTFFIDPYNFWSRFVAVKESYFKASSEGLRLTSLLIDPVWEPQLHVFCEELGVPWRQPSWVLVPDVF